MDFGVVLQTDPPSQKVIELTVMAEELGFTYGWTFDSHVLWQEPFVIYSQMLANTERKVADIAMDAGFGSLSSFYDAFQVHMKSTPAEFRRKLRDG